MENEKNKIQAWKSHGKWKFGMKSWKSHGISNFYKCLSHFFWEKCVDYLHFWHTMTLTVIYSCEISCIQKVGNSATPASALDRAAWRFYSSKCANLSPARRGRGILSRARILSGVQRHVFLWAQKLKNYWFFNVYMTFPTTWGCANDFLEMLPKLPPKVNYNFSCGHKL